MKAEGKQKELKYAILQLVMGKIRGYASWPAVILARNSAAKRSYYVAFIADESFAYLQENQMQPFTEKSVEESIDIKNKYLQLALQYAMKIYNHELTIEEYLDLYPTLLAMKDHTLADMAKETKQKIEDILANYRVAGILEYTVDQIMFLCSKGPNDSRQGSIMEMIEKKIDALLKCERVKEGMIECVHTQEKVLEVLKEFKVKVPLHKEELASKLEKLIMILS